MKILLSGLIIAGLAFVGLHLTPGLSSGHRSLHPAAEEDGPVTVSIRQNDYALCTDPFYVGIYELSARVFAAGADTVDVADYEREIFAYVRSREDMSVEQADAFIDHIQDIPRQLVEIIDEDPAVVDSCANFSVALVGPP